MNNTVGDRAEKSLEFAEMLKKRTGLPVVMWDERLTTVAANRTLMETGVRRSTGKVYRSDCSSIYSAGISGQEEQREVKDRMEKLIFRMRTERRQSFMWWNRPASAEGIIFW